MSDFGDREIAWDCKYFLGDRPCIWHKQTGVLCTCDRYERVDERLLIVKLDAMGDVLRSTALLPPLAEVHPRAAVTWVTRKESVPLLKGNPYIAEVVEVGHDALLQLATRRFDRVINLDASRTSAALASAAQSDRKDGFVLDASGTVRPTNHAARRWLEAGIFDDVKRQGRETYQDWMASILGLEGRRHRYVLELDHAERAAARSHLESIGIDWARPVVGLNTGAGAGGRSSSGVRTATWTSLHDCAGHTRSSSCSSAGHPNRRGTTGSRRRPACRSSTPAATTPFATSPRSSGAATWWSLATHSRCTCRWPWAGGPSCCSGPPVGPRSNFTASARRWCRTWRASVATRRVATSCPTVWT